MRCGVLSEKTNRKWFTSDGIKAMENRKKSYKVHDYLLKEITRNWRRVKF